MPIVSDTQALLQSRTYAVVGASRSPDKYGFLVYRALKDASKAVYPVNARAETVDSDPCYASLDALPLVPEVAVMIVPPPATEAAIEDCIRLGIGRVWMQPGAESDSAIRAARDAGITVVAGGPCILVGLRTAQYAAPNVSSL